MKSSKDSVVKRCQALSLWHTKDKLQKTFILCIIYIVYARISSFLFVPNIACSNFYLSQCQFVSSSLQHDKDTFRKVNGKCVY